MVPYAEATIECRDAQYARPLFDWLAPWADQMSCTGIAADGPVSHFLGGLATILGRYDEADTYFTQAAAFNDRVGAKFFAARTNLSWGRMLAERAVLQATRRRHATFSPRRTPSQRPTDTRTSNDAPPKHSNTWTEHLPSSKVSDDTRRSTPTEHPQRAARDSRERLRPGVR